MALMGFSMPSTFGHLGGRDDLRARADLRVHLRLRDRAVLIGVQVHEPCARRAARLLPGDEVRVVLHDGDAHLVARLEHGRGEGVRHEVERLARVAGEHDLARVRRADEARDMGARRLDGLGGLDRQAVQAAQGVRVHVLVERALRVEGHGGALRRRRAVEEGEVGVRGEQGEVLLVGVGGDVDRVAHATASSSAMPRAAARRATAARVRSSGAPMAASSNAAAMNRRSASSGDMPRLAR